MKNYLFLLLIFLIASCKKNEDPIPVVEQPVFKATGTINGQPLNIQAGVDDYIMYSDYTFDSNASVFEFNGSLRKFNCASCANSLNIKIRNYKQTVSSQTIFPDSAFVNNYYAVRAAANASTNYVLNFNGQTFGNVSQTKWVFGDGNSTNGINVQHTYTHPGKYTVGFIVQYANGCLDTILNTFRFGIPEAVCRANFNPAIFGDSIAVSNFSVGAGALSYQWLFGDGNTSTDFEPYHIYNNPGVYNITLIVTDIENHISEFKRKVIILPSTDCLASMNFPSIIAEPNPNNLSTATIEYVDANGITYSSLNNPQADSSFFKIISVEDYATNANGNKVKKLRVQLRSKLYNSSQTAFVDLNISDAVIGVAYK